VDAGCGGPLRRTAGDPGRVGGGGRYLDTMGAGGGGMGNRRLWPPFMLGRTSGFLVWPPPPPWSLMIMLSSSSMSSASSITNGAS
jgi:hypothetical protein